MSAMHPVYPVTRILIRRNEESNCWIAQCVDFDLQTQAKSYEDIPKAFGHVYYGHCIMALERGEEISFRAAPKEVRDKWRGATEASREAKIIAWSEFVPDWLPDAFAKLKHKLSSFPQPQELLLKAS